MVQELIEKAKNKYPVSIYYTGQLIICGRNIQVFCPSAIGDIRYFGLTGI